MLGCIIAYSGAYVGRHHFAMLLPSIRGEFGLTSTQAGTILSLFALLYAAGQLISGTIVDRINPRRYLFAGLFGSVLCNILLGFSNSFAMLLVAWGLNGVTQSMLWSPVVRIASLNFSEDKRSTVSFALSIFMPIANVIAWIIAGQMSTIGSWRMGTYVPAAVMLVSTFVSMSLLKESIISASRVNHENKSNPINYKTLMISTGLGLLVMCCIGMGFVRDSIINWGPTILIGMTSLSTEIALRVSLVIPVLSILGVVLSKYLFSLIRNNPYHTLTLMLTIAAGWAAALLILEPAYALLFALFLALLSMFLAGANPMVTSLIPMMFERTGRVGTVAGIVDCSFYIGSSLSGIATGLITVKYGWDNVIQIWLAVGLIVAVLSYASGKLFYKHAQSKQAA